jgi:hypothetical protein
MTGHRRNEDTVKKLVTICTLVAALIGVVAIKAGAIPIAGDISFAGNAKLDNSNLNLATEFLSFGFVFVTSTDGDYGLITPGTTATFTPFQIRPPDASVMPLWTLGFDGNTYSLDALSLAIQFSNQNSLVIGGWGVAHITGFDDTFGIWNITANSAGKTFSFSSSTSTAPVPEPSTMLLLGSGLLGLWGLRRKFKK